MHEQNSLGKLMFRAVDGASLAFFRKAFGILMFLESLKPIYDHGRMMLYEPGYVIRFHYWGFHWVKPWPGMGMYWHFGVMAAAALGIAFARGLAYRLSALLFFLGFAFVFLIDRANYLNHYYLITIVSFLMIFIPLDSDRIPAWALWLFRFQFGVVYFFGGVAKLDGDWRAGYPIAWWLMNRTDTPVIGRFFLDEWMIQSFSWGGLLFDLSIVPLLLWRKIRWLGAAGVVVFHLMNATTWEIGVFPWMMLAATTIFFEPDWPRRVLARCNFPWKRGRAALPPPRAWKRRTVLALAGLHAAVQVFLPLRCWLYAGNVNWTEEGHRFSWRMMLRSKIGVVVFKVKNPLTGKSVLVVPDDDYLSARQQRKLSMYPDMILQMAHFLSRKFAAADGRPAEVYVDAVVTLNVGPMRRFIDPHVNLAAEREGLHEYKWILRHDD
jgi:hypothetical protein